MGIPENSRFVCLNVRDSAYLNNHLPGDWDYHNYRDSDIKNYILAAEELVMRGYYVIRMGAIVLKPFNCENDKIIDYSTNGMRDDFMDIYIGAKCTFCISTGTGWDSVPCIFRRPIAYVNFSPLSCLMNYNRQNISITKRCFSTINGHELNLKEIFSSGAGFSYTTAEYESKGVHLVENTPEEIRAIAVEMDERLNGTWQAHEEDDMLQKSFWEIFPVDAVNPNDGLPLHGRILGRFGAEFLRNNKIWLQ